MAQKYHTRILSEERSKDGRGVIIRERPVKCSGTSDCEYCGSERRSRRPSKLDFSSSSPSSSVKDRLPTPFNFEYKPVHRSSRESGERHRERRSSERDHYYSDGERMGDYNLHRRSSSRSAAEPIPIPKPKPTRASTMYEDDIYDRYYTTLSRRASDRDSSRRSPPSRHESARVYPWSYDVLGSSTSTREPSQRPSRRRRHSIEVHQPEFPISYGSSPVSNSFTSTPYGSYRSSAAHSRNTSMSQSPPKSVRWGDDPRAIQNAKIESRPKHSRNISGAGTGPHPAGEVRSILKKPGDSATSSAEAPAVQDLNEDQYAALYRSAQGIGAEDRATSPQRRVLRDRAGRGDYDMIDNLRKRIGGDRGYSFDMPPRRFTGSYGEKASSAGRRPEWFYDDRYSDRRW